MALPVTITGISTAVAPVGPFKCDHSIYIANTFNVTNITFGTSTISHAAQVFTVGASNVTVPYITPFISKNLTPTDDLIMEIRTTSGGVPTATVVATSNAVAGGSFSSGYIYFTFAAPPTLTAGTQYAMVLSRSGAASATVNYVWVCGTGNTYAGGGAFTSLGGSSFSTSANDCSFRIFSDVPAYYFFGRDGTTATTLQAFKSTAPDTSWGSIATQTGFTTAILGLSSYQVGAIVHIAVMDGTLASSVAQKYAAFNMATDTFVGATETISAAANGAGQVAGVGMGTSLVVRSTGEVVAFYNGLQTKTSGTFYARVYYSRRTGAGAWSAAVQVDGNAAFDNQYPEAILGDTDRVHFIYRRSNTIWYRTLSAANALSTDTASASAAAPPAIGVAYLDGGTTRLMVASSWTTTDTSTMTATSSDTATWGTPLYHSSTQTGSIPFAMPIGLFVDGTTLWLFARRSTDSDLYIKYSTDIGVTWTAPTVMFAGTIASNNIGLSIDGTIYQRGSNVVIPYIVNDSGTLKYNEYTVRSLTVGYTLPAAVGAVALAGATTGLRADRRMAAAPGAIALAGIAAGGAKGTKVAAATGAITLAGQAANLVWHHVYSMPAAKGSVVVTFNAATLAGTRKLTADAGAVAVSMKAAALRHGHALPAAPGAVTLAGNPANLVYRLAYRLSAAPGAITLTGIPVTFGQKLAYTMPAAKGTIALTGNPAALGTSANKVMGAATGAVTLSGQQAALRAARRVTAVKGAVALAGLPVALRATRTLTAAKGAIALTGNDATLKLRRVIKMLAAPGAIVLTGNPVVLSTKLDRVMVAAKGSVTLTGTAVALLVPRTMSVTAGAITLSGVPVNLDYHAHMDYRIEAAPEAVVIAASRAELQHGNRQPGRITYGRRAYIPGRW